MSFKTTPWTVACVLAALVMGCSSGATDRGGPDSLVGVRWQGEPIDIPGGTVEPAFEFGRNDVTLTNRCTGGDDLTVSVSAPVRYHYRVTTEGAQDGDEACLLRVEPGDSTFEIVDGQLRWRFGGEEVVFDPAGSVAGLYGDWTADTATVGRFQFSVGDGRLMARLDCTGGGSAEVDVPAVFTNLLDITAPASDEVMRGGQTCSASIAAANDIPYRFDGDTLVMTFDGSEARFTP